MGDLVGLQIQSLDDELFELDEKIDQEMIANAEFWSSNEDAQDRIRVLALTFDGFADLANIGVGDDDFPVIGMHWIKVYTEEMSDVNRLKFVKVLCDQLGLNVSLKETENKNG